MPQIYEVVKQEHQQVSRLLNQLTEGQPTKQMIQELYTMLEAHTKAEEKTFYKDLEKSEQTQEIVLEGIEEHHVADVLLEEIIKLRSNDKRLKAKLMVLKENVEHHVQEEEQQMFPKARRMMDTQWAEQMAQKFEKQEETLKKKYQ